MARLVWLTLVWNVRQAFRMAAMGGARAVGLQDQTGLVQVGRSADLVLYDLASSLSILPRTDILGYAPARALAFPAFFLC